MNIYSVSEIKEKISSFLQENKTGIIEILGPTASGKSNFAVFIAREFAPIEIISVDSRQVFREFDISAVKMTEAEKKGIPHWGIDLIELDQPYSVAEFQAYAFKKIKDIQTRNKRVILCGGTMLWLDAISENYIFSDKKNQKSTEQGIPKWPILKIGIHRDREDLYNRCNKRSEWLFQNGLIEEVERVSKAYPKQTKSAQTNFGYTEVLQYKKNQITYQEALEINKKRNRNYAKRQLTWWRNRDDILWVSGESVDRIKK